MVATPAVPDPAVPDSARRADEDPDADFPTEVVVRELPAADVDAVADPDADFPTEVVDRSQPTDEATYATLAIDRAAARSDDGRDDSAPLTSASRADAAVATPADPAPRPSLRGRRAIRRRGITFPPMEPGARTSVAAVGPGAVEAYPVRELAPPPEPPEVVASGPAATRAPAPSMPSVERRSRRIGGVTILLMIGAVVVSAVGLALIALAVFG